MKDIMAVILAGGVGKRFRPLTTSKPLMKFLSKPLIEHTLEAVAQAGVSRIVVVTNPQNDQTFRKFRIRGGEIRTVVQEKALGMADALLTAGKHIINHSILVVNASDIVEPTLVRKVLTTSRNQEIDLVIPGLESDQYFPGGYLKMDGDRLKAIVEKPGEGKQPSNLVNLVVHFIRDTDRLLQEISGLVQTGDNAYEQALSKLLATNNGFVVRYRGKFGYLKYPWDILNINRMLLQSLTKTKVSPQAKIHETAILEGPVEVAQGAQILEQAVIKGPVFIGSNAVVGTGSLIIESNIESHCVIGFASEVVRSYIGEGSWLHHNYIGDSVLEGRNSLGAGAVTANFRFDEREVVSRVGTERITTKRHKLGAILATDARVGVNSSLMPGVKIGAGSFIGPGVVQYTDLDERMMVLVDAKKTYKTIARNQ